jgi:hypothetical protein
MKEPRYRLDMELSYDEVLGLLWSAQWVYKNAPDDVYYIPQKQTIRKLEGAARRIGREANAWRRANLKCAASAL